MPLRKEGAVHFPRSGVLKMASKVVVLVLGDEYDNALREVLRAVLENSGAVEIDKSWGVGGSQEIERLVVALGDASISIEAETFVGITISGPKGVVEDIALQVKRRLLV